MKQKKKNGRNAEKQGPGQPRIDPAGVLERRSVGLPASWWAEIDRLTKARKVKAAVLVRAAVGIYLKKIGRAERSIRNR